MLWRCFVPWLLCLLCWGQPPLLAHADGEAPNVAYVAESTGVSVIDILQRRHSKTFSLSGEPRMLLLSLDGRLLYISQPAQGRVLVLETATGKTHCSIALPRHPSLLALPFQEDSLYVAGNDDANIRAIDPASCRLQRTLPTPGPVAGLAVSLTSASFSGATGLYQLWVATTNGLVVLDTDGKQLADFSLSAEPGNLSIPPGGVVYGTTRQGTVIALDPFTRQVTSPLLTGGTFGTMDFDESTGEVYVPDLLHQQIDVLTPLSVGIAERPHEPNRVIHLNGVPEAVAITGDGQLGFVALQDGRVTMLDLPGRRTVTTIAVGGHPHFIITGLYPPPASETPQPQTTEQHASSLFPLNWLIVEVVLLAIAVFLIGFLLWRYRFR